MMDSAIVGLSGRSEDVDSGHYHYCDDLGMAGQVDQEAVQHYCRVGLMQALSQVSEAADRILRL